MATENSIVLQVPEPSSDYRWKDAPESIKEQFYRHAAEQATMLKLTELRAGKSKSGSPLRPVKPSSRRDGAKGPPLSPHYAESRSQKWIRTAIGRKAKTVTIYWSHGWGRILGYHAYTLRIRRNVIGLTAADTRKFHEECIAYWKRIRHKAFAREEEEVKEEVKPEVSVVSAAPGTVGPIRAREKQSEEMNKIGRALGESAQKTTAGVSEPPHEKIPKWVAAAVRWGEKAGAKVIVAGQDEFPPGAPAVYNWKTDVIKINKDHSKWLDPEKAMRSAKDRGWMSTDHPAHYITHELGHKAHRDSVVFGTLSKEEQTKVFKGFLAPPRADLIPKIEKLVSKYATSSQHEFVAETFAMLRVNQTVDPILLTYYKSLGGAIPDAYRSNMPRLQTS